MFPENVLEILREMWDLETDDSSRDAELNELPPDVAFEMLLNWHGIYGYADTIKFAISDIYGFDIDEMLEYNTNH